jgi:hypothetical protein
MKLIPKIGGGFYLFIRPLPIRRNGDDNEILFSVKPYHIKKSLEDGENDLGELAQNSIAECAWSYDHDHSEWYNLSLKRTISTSNNKLEIGLKCRMPNFDQVSTRITHYHTHPSSTWLLAAQAEYFRIFKRIDPKVTPEMMDFPKLLPWKKLQERIPLTSLIELTKYLSNYADLKTALPSEEDIKSGHKLTQVSQSDLDFAVLSSRYKITTQFNPDLPLQETLDTYLAALQGIPTPDAFFFESQDKYKLYREYISREEPNYMSFGDAANSYFEACLSESTPSGIELTISQNPSKPKYHNRLEEMFQIDHTWLLR